MYFLVAGSKFLDIVVNAIWVSLNNKHNATQELMFKEGVNL